MTNEQQEELRNHILKWVSKHKTIPLGKSLNIILNFTDTPVVTVSVPGDISELEKFCRNFPVSLCMKLERGLDIDNVRDLVGFLNLTTDKINRYRGIGRRSLYIIREVLCRTGNSNSILSQSINEYLDPRTLRTATQEAGAGKVLPLTPGDWQKMKESLGRKGGRKGDWYASIQSEILEMLHRSDNAPLKVTDTRLDNRNILFHMSRRWSVDGLPFRIRESKGTLQITVYQSQ